MASISHKHHIKAGRNVPHNSVLYSGPMGDASTPGEGDRVIVIEEQNDLLKMHVYGALTLADYGELEKAVTGGLKAAPKVRLLMDLARMSGFTVDVAWEDIRFTRAHAHDFRRIAVVTDSRWRGWIGWLSAAFTDAEVETFADIAAAETWLER